MKTYLSISMLLLVLFFGHQTSHGQIIIDLDVVKCDITLENHVTGYISNCAQNPSLVPNAPYFYTLQKKVNGSFTNVANSGYTNATTYSFASAGPGTYRVIMRVWKETGNIIKPKGANFPCQEIAEFYFTSDEITVDEFLDWVAYPLGSGDKSEAHVGVRAHNPEERVYYISQDNLWVYEWTGAAWAKSELVSGVNDVTGPFKAEPGASSNIYCRTSNGRLRLFQQDASGNWTQQILSGNYPDVSAQGQIEAGPEGVFYVGASTNKLHLVTPDASGGTTTLDLDVTGTTTPTPYMARLDNGFLLYRTSTGAVEGVIPSSGAYSASQRSVDDRAQAANMATDGARLYFIGTDGRVQNWFPDGFTFFFQPSGFGFTGNVNGHIAASPERRSEIFYLADDQRIWRIEFTTGFINEFALASNTNVQGPIAAKRKIPYLSASNDIWHQYEVVCPAKTLIPLGEEADAPAPVHMNIFPNPAHELLKVNMEVRTDIQGSIQLMDIQGRLIREIRSTELFREGSQDFQVEVADLERGSYFLQWRSQDFVHTVPVILQ